MPTISGIPRYVLGAGALVLAACSAPAASPQGASALPAVPAGRAASSVPQPWPSGGATLVYAGRLRQTGGPNPVSLSVADRVTTASGTFRGRPAVVYHAIETESGKGANAQITYDVTVEQRRSAIRNGVDVVAVKTGLHASGGVREIVVNDPGNGVFDQVPEVPQARWSDTAARTETIVDAAAGSSLTDRYRADGSYDESGVPVEGRQSLAQTFANGDAVYQWPFEGSPLNSTIAFSSPYKGLIPILFTNAGNMVTETARVGVWYPRVPPVLAGDLFVDDGTVRVPKACAAAKGFAGKATQIVERKTRLDVVFGEYETTQRTSYVRAPYGVVCSDLHDELLTYYDYENFNLSHKPLSDVVTDETLGLQQASGNAAAAAIETALPLDAGIAARRAAARLQSAKAIFRSLRFVRKHE